MTKWRPEKWYNPHVDEFAKKNGYPDSIYESVFEAGADAMLEAIKNIGLRGRLRWTQNEYGGSTLEGNKVIVVLEEEFGKMTVSSFLEHNWAKKGTLVFIPDDMDLKETK